MSDVFFKDKAGDRVFELDKLTLGDARVLKREFGLEDMEDFSPTDPDHLVGLLYLCLRREQPNAAQEDLLGEIEDLDINAFDEIPEEPDPTPAAEAGGSAKTRKKTGARS